MGSSRARSVVLLVAVVTVVLLVGVALIFLLVPRERVLSSFPIDEITHGEGPPWTNSRTGTTGGPDYVDDSIPFENDTGCGSDESASSISWQRGWYLQAWTGPRNMVTGRYLASTELPQDAVFTGWERPGERLWFAPSDRTRPGEYRFLYVERPDTVERWPRATFGCA